MKNYSRPLSERGAGILASTGKWPEISLCILHKPGISEFKILSVTQYIFECDSEIFLAKNIPYTPNLSKAAIFHT